MATATITLTDRDEHGIRIVCGLEDGEALAPASQLAWAICKELAGTRGTAAHFEVKAAPQGEVARLIDRAKSR